MTLEYRIFLESRNASITPAGHLYLVKRQVLTDQIGNYQNLSNPADDLVIQGTVGIIVGGDLRVNAGVLLASTSDGYEDGVTPADRHSVDIIAQILAGSGATNIHAAWDQMADYGTDINDAQYDYELPDGVENHESNSGATILSVLNSVNVDIRTIPAPNGTDLFVDSFYAGSHPGATNDYDPTLLGQGRGDAATPTITASNQQQSGLKILGRDDVDDILVGTRFDDWYFGEQLVSYSTTYDIVDYERVPEDRGTSRGIEVRVRQGNLSAVPFSTEPWEFYGVNDDRQLADILFGIEEVKLTRFFDMLYIEPQTFEGGLAGDVAPLVIDMGDYATGAINSNDWDEVSYVGLEHGITMVNGTTRIGSDNGPLPDSFLGKLGEIAGLLQYFVGLPPDLLAFATFASNDPVRVTGAEIITGTDFDDTLWFGDVGFLGRVLGRWPLDADRPRIGEIDGGRGNDIIVHYGGEFVQAGSVIDEALGGATDGLTIAAEDLHLTIHGSQGDDRLYASGGAGTIVVGGDGRDFLFNTSLGGQLYGDRIDGIGQSNSGLEDADVFWFWPGTSIMDAAPNDILELFGLPMVGGSNAILGYTTATGGGLAIDTINWTTFYGFTGAGQLYIYSKLITNANVPSGVSVVDNKFLHVQLVENYDFGGFSKDEDLVDFGIVVPGDLGLTFRIYVAEGGKEISLFNDAWGTLIQLTHTWFNFIKLIQWKPVDDPLVLDLDGDGIETVSQSQSGVHFDLDNDFFAEATGWLSSDDGFLVLDKNNDGRIEDASELFGGPGLGAFEELASYDAVAEGGNEDGVITADDAVFNRLQVWRDLDQDGVTDEGELFSLADVDIVSLDVSGAALDSVTPQGTTLRAQGTFTRADGTTGDSFEAIFETGATDTIYRGERGTAAWLKSDFAAGIAAVPDAKGFGSMTDLAVAVSNDFELEAIVRDVSRISSQQGGISARLAASCPA